MIRRLLIGPELGRGGYAVVRQAYEPDQKRRFAWKELREEKARQAHLATAHHAEAWILSQVNHPAIPHVYAYDSRRHAFVMDLIPGISLDRLFLRWDQAPLPVRAKLAVEIIEAVFEIHRRGFLHLDLKLANLLLAPGGKLALVDFGVAALHWLNTTAETAYPLPVSASYAAPEMIPRNPVYDARADVYSLAVVVYALLSGRRPYRLAEAGIEETLEQLQQIHSQGIRPVVAGDVGLPDSVNRAILAGLAYDPRQRTPKVVPFGREVIAGLTGLEIASAEEMASWTSAILAAETDEAPALAPWDGRDPEEVYEPTEEALMIDAPALVSKITEVSAEPESLEAKGEVLVSWQPVIPDEDYEVAVLSPGDIRPREVRATACPLALDLDQRGQHRLRVRAVSDGLKGAWSEEVVVPVGRPGPPKGLVYGIAGAVAVVLVAVVFLVAGGGRRSEADRQIPMPEEIQLAQSVDGAGSQLEAVPSAGASEPEDDATSGPEVESLSGIPAWQQPTLVAEEDPSSAPLAEPTVAVAAVPSSPVPTGVVRVLAAGPGGYRVHQINGSRQTADGKPMPAAKVDIDARLLRIGSNSVILGKSASGTAATYEFSISNDEINDLRSGSWVPVPVQGADAVTLRLKFLASDS